jgi:hypothetical protein
LATREIETFLRDRQIEIRYDICTHPGGGLPAGGSPPGTSTAWSRTGMRLPVFPPWIGCVPHGNTEEEETMRAVPTLVLVACAFVAAPALSKDERKGQRAGNHESAANADRSTLAAT